MTETEAPKPAKSEEEVQSHGVAKADEVTKSDESSKDNNTKVAAKLATTPKTPSDSERFKEQHSFNLGDYLCSNCKSSSSWLWFGHRKDSFA